MPRRLLEVRKVLAVAIGVIVLGTLWLANDRQPVPKTAQQYSKTDVSDTEAFSSSEFLIQNKLKEYHIENANSEPYNSSIPRKIFTETAKEVENWTRSEYKAINYSKSFPEVTHDAEAKNISKHADARNMDDETTSVTKQDYWGVEQELRKLAIQEACRGIPRDLRFKHLMEDSKEKLSHLLVDDERKVIYCYVPKVACTNWKRLWLILNGLSETKDPLEIPMYLPHAKHGYMMLTNQRLGPKLLEHKLQTYTKFLFVRHPFERLLSAFRDKLENLGHEKKPYWKLAVNMMSKVRKNSREVNPDGLGVRFEEFVRFALEYPNWLNDDHFTQYEELCRPCAISYDYIGKYESLIEDAEHILRAIDAPPEMHFPPFAPWANTSHVVNKYYGTLSEEQIIKLYKLYQRDFQLFQYD